MTASDAPTPPSAVDPAELERIYRQTLAEMTALLPRRGEDEERPAAA